MATVKKKIKTDRYPELKESLKYLNSHKLRVGVFGEDDSLMVKIAASNEFGADIKPVKAKFLVIPLTKTAKKNRPRDIDGLYTLRAGGELYLVKNRGKEDIVFHYWLSKHVKIPERSFIRGSYDENKHNIFKRNRRELNALLGFQIDRNQYFDKMGEYMVGLTKKYMTDLKNPANSGITLSAKSPKSNPLINSGRLRNSVVWKVERK